MLDGCTPEQLAVLEPPYAIRLDRPMVVPAGAEDDEEGAEGVKIEVKSRAAAKKEFDREVFQTEYF